ncbi:uncharacterized protein Z518_08334 [Rhinocladiella mackenziei CBS 650.93]|uniref:Uncharacterized protein n=1 Tax=Rhinocladiella mackenziei CBS 650.93 TaxID=1442369 RepID=A0A0D2GVV7_9EURO|nr:uncharacterized protein Z518_08334 [Rhinocladiella mackenziei CBS 650.93]KIX02393.1 hypothetical protein Z518_08334 [Rhinocladiella mackenziei CBS 650.93]
MAMMQEYLRAVRFYLCSHPDPYSDSYNFEDCGFWKIFYGEVIFNLEENLLPRFEIGDKIWTEDS